MCTKNEIKLTINNINNVKSSRKNIQLTENNPDCIHVPQSNSNMYGLCITLLIKNSINIKFKKQQ